MNLECWKESKEFKSSFHGKNFESEDLKELWAQFHNRMLNESKQEHPKFQGIIWQNLLTEHKLKKYLPADNYIIQTWKNIQTVR